MKGKPKRMKTSRKLKAVLISCAALPIVMTVAFAILRTAEHINWDWVWVLAPIWTAAVITLTMLTVLAVYGVVMFFITIHRENKDIYRG